MNLLLDQDLDALVNNGNLIEAYQDDDFYPVVKLCTADNKSIWILLGIDTCDANVVYCLYNHGQVKPKFGPINISELNDFRDEFGQPLERQNAWKPSATMSDLREQAANDGYIRC